MFEYVLGAIDPDGDGYPSGPGMVEVEGMGAEKLDSAAYTWAALRALAGMAAALGKEEDALQAASQAERIAARFDGDWWDSQGGTYAMSLQEDNTRYPVAHWAVIVPLEVGLASAPHAAQTFSTLRAAYMNRWGLKHTVGDDERVWTLPTAALSRAAYHYGEPELGFEMLRHIAETLDTGSIGQFHELIPQGACFLQLWSAAVFLRGVVEDLLGIEVLAAEHHLVLAPQVPAQWEGVGLEDLLFGEHRISLQIDRQTITVQHHSGPEPLVVQYGEQSAALAAGASAAFVCQ
jgi:glycogen debranching enzyme